MTVLACPRRRAATQGFTLIEMMVVVVLLGLVSALTLPSMQRWHDAVQARAQMALVVEALRGAMFSAASRRQDILMDQHSFTPTGQVKGQTKGQTEGQAAEPAQATAPERAKVLLPTGWTVERVVDATFMKNGLCRPGYALLRNPSGQRLLVQVSGPACSIDTPPDLPAGMR
jgi:prepilin-type N-terminal cleavage/methylation domain-containing protein